MARSGLKVIVSWELPSGCLAVLQDVDGPLDWAAVSGSYAVLLVWIGFLVVSGAHPYDAWPGTTVADSHPVAWMKSASLGCDPSVWFSTAVQWRTG